MDQNGVPEKINRHVFKAITHYMDTKKDISFMQIYKFVKKCNKNLKPVQNLRETVHRSLDNFQHVGFITITKVRGNRFIMSSVLARKLSQRSIATKAQTLKPARSGILANYSIWLEKETDHFTNFSVKKERKPHIQPRLPSESKKRRHSESSLDVESDSGKRSIKRFRGQKNGMNERKGNRTNLPGARKSEAIGSKQLKMPSKHLCVPRRVDFRPIKVETLRKKNKTRVNDPLNFDVAQLGEPGADDRDSGDEFHEGSQESLRGLVENNQPVSNSVDPALNDGNESKSTTSTTNAVAGSSSSKNPTDDENEPNSSTTPRTDTFSSYFI